jgi:undecaprenyl-diphosphatase
LALALAFLVDRRVYVDVSGAACQMAGHKPWRFERPEGGRVPKLDEVLTLFKRMGEVWFLAVVATTMLLLAPQRKGQVVALFVAVAVTVVVGQGLLKHAIAKMRPDAELSPLEVERLVAKGGEPVRVRGKTLNKGWALFRTPFSREHSGLTFPSGHTALAFAVAAVLGAAFPQARWWFLFLACGVGASRVLMGEHVLSDVIAGGGVGYACARGVLAVPRVRRLMAGGMTGT